MIVWLAGLVPVVLVNWLTRPFVTSAWLRLPQHARTSAQTAVQYARKLPSNAVLELDFLRSTMLPGRIEAKVTDIMPAARSWPPVTFRCIGPEADRGSWLRPNPTEFFVSPESAKGAAARNTIPGLWGNVYKRLAGVESEAVAKWRR